MDCDGLVGASDLALLLGAWGATGCSQPTCVGCVEEPGPENNEAMTQLDAATDLPWEVVVALSGQPTPEAFAIWVDGLSTSQRSAFVSALEALCQGGTDQ